MEFKKKKLDNGLVLVGEVNRSAKSAAVGFFVKTGSRDETRQINGVSHYLEHMLFKGTDKLSALEVNEAFDMTGAQFNAFTSEENTVFYAAILPEYLIEVTQLWIELMRPALRDEDFEIEKDVIKEEIVRPKTIDINTAGEKDLVLLEGIGPALAERIISYRNTNGPFTFKEDIVKVKGIGAKKFDKIKNSIDVQ